ncbi:hypothetical protein D3C81_1089910 [compost metagenome]
MGNLLSVEDAVDALDQVEVDHRVVGVVVFAQQFAALVGRFVVDQVGIVGREDLIDEGAVVGGLEGRAAQNHVDLD